MDKVKLKQVKMTEITNSMVLEIVANRLFENNPVTSKQGVVHEAIALLYKKEIKK
jgi:hypothetical protein